ncbi:MAG: hypothetical protein HQL22_02595, partial [Candidatus Omnitrophica bacterium]|nr:hypothetical protein [Candidatus Omnitrophota bacterium]
NPEPINGGWCAFSRCINGFQVRECACPRPAFNGTECDGNATAECTDGPIGTIGCPDTMHFLIGSGDQKCGCYPNEIIVDAANADGTTTKKCKPCPEGQSNCNGVCTNLQTDTANCGTCGQSCPAGKMCADGICGCSASTTLPGSGEACTTVCGCSGQNVCNAGICSLYDPNCPAGQIHCDGGPCVDYNADSNNCGACGKQCAAHMACSSGQCVCAPQCTNVLCGGSDGCGGTCDADGCVLSQDKTVMNCNLVTLQNCNPFNGLIFTTTCPLNPMPGGGGFNIALTNGKCVIPKGGCQVTVRCQKYTPGPVGPVQVNH